VAECQWRTLFNIHLPPDQQSAGCIVPDELELFAPEPEIGKYEMGPMQFTPQNNVSGGASSGLNAYVASRLQYRAFAKARSPGMNVQGLSYSFTFSSSASLAYIGSSVRSWADDRVLYRYTAYAVRNIARWEALIKREGWEGINVKKLVLVHESTLAPVWVTGVYQSKTDSAAIGAQLTVHCGTSASISLSVTNASTPGFQYNYGPYARLRSLPTSPDADSGPTSKTVEAGNILLNTGSRAVDSGNGSESAMPSSSLPSSATNHGAESVPYDADQSLFVKGVLVARMSREDKKKHRDSKGGEVLRIRGGGPSGRLSVGHFSVGQSKLASTQVKKESDSIAPRSMPQYSSPVPTSGHISVESRHCSEGLRPSRSPSPTNVSPEVDGMSHCYHSP
jgi:hypothetical protein